MRIVGEYLAKAAVFEALNASERNPETKRQYADLASYYSDLAQQRRWMLTTQQVKSPFQAAVAPA